ncbi:MAG: peptidoglycan bridge formation glycyltransferase FemA/FemB family protein [Treponema sp.]|jgi:lipid II:glycine glycyltransferase (peptidoglycan interpeptide bridge formation enzyme)|nr:peptidoglycan bridge formation glycyltransferase FemA/FemB family protein [Treponema sp.]
MILDKGQPIFKNIIPAELSVCDSAENFLQSGFWGSFKACFGWNVRSFIIEWADETKTPLSVIRRRLMRGISFAYMPWGPQFPKGLNLSDEEKSCVLADLAKSLRELLPKDTVFIRFDPPWYSEGAETPAPQIGAPFSRSGADIQPPDTVILNLEETEDAILEAMKPKWRYNIRLAEKKGVTIRRADEDGLQTFYNLFQATAKRDGIAIHSIEYYETLFSHCKNYPDQTQDIALYLAEHEGEAISGVIILFRGAESVYLYGASADHKRNLMAPYALQWQAIKDAKAASCTSYDFFGIPPNEDPSHPMAGLYRFKTGFGGKIIHRPGSWDFVYRPAVRKIFSAAESFRKNIRTLKKQRRNKKV